MAVAEKKKKKVRMCVRCKKAPVAPGNYFFCSQCFTKASRDDVIVPEITRGPQ